jgi:hypothetical protein
MPMKKLIRAVMVHCELMTVEQLLEALVNIACGHGKKFET